MTSEKRPQTRLTGTASQFAVYAEMTAARSRGGFSFDPNTCGYIENDPRATRSAGTTPSPAGSKGGVDPMGNLLLSGQKGQEEERSYQRKTRHEKGHNRSMFLNQRIQHVYRSHDAPPRSKPALKEECILAGALKACCGSAATAPLCLVFHATAARRLAFLGSARQK
jgi:hypothetical protein